MAKRDSFEHDNRWVKVEDDEPVEELVIEDISTVRLVLLKDINLNINGPVTGIQYVFSRAGAEVDVDSRDAG